MILNNINVYVTNDTSESKISNLKENKIDLNSAAIGEDRSLLNALSNQNSSPSSSNSKKVDDQNNYEDNNSEEASASRNILVKQLVKQGTFNFAGYIENEVTASALVLFKNLAKYYEIPFYEVNKISTDPTYSEKLKEKEYSGWLPKAVEDFGLDWQDVWEPIHNRMDFCYELAGIAYNKSVAASGVIMATGKTILPVHDGAIGYNSVDLENWGYIKYDLLSVNTLNSIQYFKGVDFDWNENEDKEVWESIKGGDLDFTFQLSGYTPKRMCVEGLGALDKIEKEKEVERKNKDKYNNTKEVLMIDDKQETEYWWKHGIDRISEVSAINRPGPLSIDMDKIWVDICSGNYVASNKNDMIIERILKSKFGNAHMGIIAYQEDIMGLCTDGSGFTLSQADDVRKGMGKKKQELIDAKKPQFIENWKYNEIFEINGLGFFKSDDQIELTDGSKILASDLYDRLQKGETFDIKTV